MTSLDEHTGRRNPYLKGGVRYEEAQSRVRRNGGGMVDTM